MNNLSSSTASPHPSEIKYLLIFMLCLYARQKLKIHNIQDNTLQGSHVLATQTLKKFQQSLRLSFRRDILHKVTTYRYMNNYFISKFKDNYKICMMSLLIFFTVVSYNVMRAMKEALVLNLPGATAAYIPYIKSFVVLPSSIVMGAVYLALKQKYGLLKTYYIVTVGMLSYFVLFSTVLTPYMSSVTPSSEFVAYYQQLYPSLKFFLGIFANWPSTLFYTFSELWGTFTLIILFWQIANEIFTTSNARVYYPLLNLVGAFAIVAASVIVSILSQSSNPLNTCVCFMTILAIGMIVTATHLKPYINTHANTQNTKAKTSLTSNFKVAISSPYILFITICIFAFGILVNTIELSFKELMIKYFHGQAGYLSFYSTFTKWKGLLAIAANVFTLHYLKRLGWFSMAIVTPLICLLSLALVLGPSTFTQLNIDVYTGGLNEYWFAWLCCSVVIMMYASKYAFFDTTKEMAFIPLPENLKVSGKAAADGIGGRSGKSGSSLIQLCIFQITGDGTYSNNAPYFFVICAVILACWLWALIKLNHEYVKMAEPQTNKNTGATIPNTDQRPKLTIA